jgi:hypothetical protein
VAAAEPPASAPELSDAFPSFGGAQSTPIAPPSGSDLAPPAEPSVSVEPIAVPAGHSPSYQPSLIPDSRRVDLSGPPAAADVQPEPLPNGGFEQSTEGWDGANAALTLVRGVTGSAVRVTRAATEQRFAFYAVKQLVSRKAGASYRVGAHVRSVSPGMLVCLRVEEYAGGAPLTTERCVPARSGWRRVRLEGATTRKASKLVFSIHVMAALGGTSFDVDGVRLAQS